MDSGACWISALFSLVPWVIALHFALQLADDTLETRVNAVLDLFDTISSAAGTQATGTAPVACCDAGAAK